MIGSLRMYLGWLVCLVLLIGGAATAQQEAGLNTFQEKILSLEAETTPYRNFQPEVHGLALTRAEGSAIRQSELNEVKREARTLLALAEELIIDAEDLVGPSSLYAEPGIELSTEMLYRLSAWELRSFYLWWQVALESVDGLDTTSEFGDFQRVLDWADLASEHAEQSQTYRLFANTHYRLDQLEAAD